MKKNADIILHPIRMKIIQVLGGGKALSIQQIGSVLSDVPPATLYRHVNKLLEHGFLEVVQENQVRGTVEKILKINDTAFSNQNLGELSPQEHLSLFTTFMTNLVGEFSQYVEHPDFSPVEDGAMYRQALVHLNETEWQEFLSELTQVLRKAIEKEPREDRSVRTISTIIIPQKKKKEGSK
ncbi:helix-turn-helix domain-containing protein [Ammoniphilus sp. YIM 78166]|uniref:helix-turn-helix domain-containing protein n=1 Tax=Ammoniphilus sp. YIM 78166 TaxID=1644106 RepID=UPI0014319621|nr:helix-turn-helix domain-containing protein [Ammoniphilus sp. YIM 78166]